MFVLLDNNTRVASTASVPVEEEEVKLKESN